MKLIETYECCGQEYEVFKCECGATYTVLSGGDIADCPNCIAMEAKWEAEMEAGICRGEQED